MITVVDCLSLFSIISIISSSTSSPFSLFEEPFYFFATYFETQQARIFW